MKPYLDKNGVKYRSVSQVIKKIAPDNDSNVYIQQAKHVCGSRMLCCVECNNVFCAECDYLLMDMPECCTRAMENFLEDSDNKTKKREAIRERHSKKGKSKTEIKIETLDNNNEL